MNADSIWNRALDGTGGELGDESLSALLLLHGTIMNGGLVNALETHDEEQIAAAIEGYRFFELDDAADLIVMVLGKLENDADPQELEDTYDGDFYDLVPDDETVYEAFEAKLADDPAVFAPVS